MQTNQQQPVKKPSSRQAREDLARARQYGDQLRNFLAASNTGAIGILLATAGSLVGKAVSPNWVTVPVGIFAGNLVVFGISLLIGEHRSLLRRRDKDAQSKLPTWKMAITWNIIILLIFVGGIFASVVALRSINIPTGTPGLAQLEEPKKGSELRAAMPTHEQTSVHVSAPGSIEAKTAEPGQAKPALPAIQVNADDGSPDKSR